MNNLEEQIKISRQIVLEMLSDRKYKVQDIIPHIPEILFIKLWASFVNESNVFDFECENNIGDRVYVKYIHNHIKKKTNKNTTYINFNTLHEKIKNINDLLFNDTIIYIICDTQYENLDENKKLIEFKKNKNVEIFDIQRLLFNVTKHIFVPKHEKLSILNIKTLQQVLKIDSIYKLPAIMKHDPVAKYYNLKQGDVVKITRYSKSSGKHISYRVCIENEEML